MRFSYFHALTSVKEAASLVSTSHSSHPEQPCTTTHLPRTHRKPPANTRNGHPFYLQTNTDTTRGNQSHRWHVWQGDARLVEPMMELWHLLTKMKKKSFLRPLDRRKRNGRCSAEHTVHSFSAMRNLVLTRRLKQAMTIRRLSVLSCDRCCFILFDVLH